MKGRAFLIVMDSVGCGAAPDAAEFGDSGSNTLGHIAGLCAQGRADGGRSGPLNLPHLARLGLWNAARLASSEPLPEPHPSPMGLWGVATEQSRGKDTPSGHWELAGVPVPWDWTYFPLQTPCFPANLTDKVAALARTTGILGNCHAAGVQIMNNLGAKHLQTGFPICYTSADSVFQIAAHEQYFGLERLLQLCRDIAPELHAMKVGRVIARPFVGPIGGFERSPNRRDFAQASGYTTHAIGKISDIFSGQGIDHSYHGKSDRDLSEHLLNLTDSPQDGTLIFANFVEFDSLYGHPRDVAGYARALEWFDPIVGQFLAKLRPNDLAIFTADHGNDPSFRGSDHTRERVPLLVAGAKSGTIGHCCFQDVATSIATHLDLRQKGFGRSFI
jgi:phosphopentomutase